MRNIILFLFLTAVFLYSQDSSQVTTGDTNTTSTLTAKSIKRMVLQPDDFKKFYIGFTSNHKDLEVLTLDIHDIKPQDSLMTFQYTMNTKENRQDGTGQISLTQRRIRFQNMEDGLISVPEDGKLVFESASKDSLNYWKLKEK